MTPTPREPVRGDQGHADGRFLRRLSMVCLVSLVVSGLIVYSIGEITPPQPVHPSHHSDHEPPAGDTAPAGQRPAPAREGGDGCG